MINKKAARIRRARRTRGKIRELGIHRLCVYRTPRHIYAQVIVPGGAEVIASASSLDGDIKKVLRYTGNVETATVVGKVIAERAKKAGVTQVAFDRSGFKYHGRVKALAEAAREGGLEF
jgi:large subunit ribosomal protein L18